MPSMAPKAGRGPITLRECRPSIRQTRSADLRQRRAPPRDTGARRCRRTWERRRSQIGSSVVSAGLSPPRAQTRAVPSPARCGRRSLPRIPRAVAVARTLPPRRRYRSPKFAAKAQRSATGRPRSGTIPAPARECAAAQCPPTRVRRRAARNCAREITGARVGPPLPRPAAVGAR